MQERYVWHSVDVLLEAFVFAYIGLHLRFVLEDLREAHESLAEVVVASALVLAMVLVIRPLSVFVMFGRRMLFRHVDRKLSVPIPKAADGGVGVRKRTRPEGKWRSMIDHSMLSWQESVVVSWTGMRGVVTLAAAGIPLTTAPASRSRTRHHPGHRVRRRRRHAVAAGSTLPPLIRRLQLSSREADDGLRP